MEGYRKLLLIPNETQQKILFRYANTARYSYNWALRKEHLRQNDEKGFMELYELKNQFLSLRKAKGYEWLRSVPLEISMNAVKEAFIAFLQFQKSKTSCPKFKKKGRFQFFIKSTRIEHNGIWILGKENDYYQEEEEEEVEFEEEEEVEVEEEEQCKEKEEYEEKDKKAEKKEETGVGRICFLCSKWIPKQASCRNIRIRYEDGNWYAQLLVFESEEIYIQSVKEGRKRRELRDRNEKEREDRNQKRKKLEKRRKRILRSIQRKYEKNKKGEHYHKTQNIIKKEAELERLNQRIASLFSV